MSEWEKWVSRFIFIAILLSLVATFASIIGGPENTYAHHTAVSGLGQTFFYAALWIFWRNYVRTHKD